MKIKSKPILIGGIAAVIVIIAIIIFVNVNSKVDLNDYLKIDVSGYNGYGTVSLEIDWEKFGGDNSKHITDSGSEILLKADSLMRDYISVSADKNDNLKNGDTITYHWKIKDDFKLIYDGKIKAEDGTYTVSGLNEIEKFDPFEDLTISFEGTEPNGKASIKEGTYADDITIDNTQNLSNGDTIKVSLERPDDISYYIDKYKKAPSSVSKQYKVEGLNTYVKSIDDIKNFEELKKTAVNKIKANAITDKSTEKLVDAKYIGNVIFTQKDQTGIYDANNKIALCYKVTVNNKYEKYKKNNTYYTYILFEYVTINPEGKIDNEYLKNTTTSIPSAEVVFDSGLKVWFTEMTWTYSGFKNFNELKKDVLEPEEGYDVTDNLTK